MLIAFDEGRNPTHEFLRMVAPLLDNGYTSKEVVSTSTGRLLGWEVKRKEKDNRCLLASVLTAALVAGSGAF